MNFRKLIPLLLAFAGACVTHQVTPAGAGNGGSGGATSPQAAVNAFLSAARQQDPQALALVWGTANGPARNSMTQGDLDLRSSLLMRFYRNDSAQIVEDTPGTTGQRLVRVDVACNGNHAQPTLTTVQAKDGRWFVLDAPVEPMRNLCGG